VHTPETHVPSPDEHDPPDVWTTEQARLEPHIHASQSPMVPNSLQSEGTAHSTQFPLASHFPPCCPHAWFVSGETPQIPDAQVLV
jgi:hypothetical protein